MRLIIVFYLKRYIRAIHINGFVMTVLEAKRTV